jgi:hypothetical protein
MTGMTGAAKEGGDRRLVAEGNLDPGRLMGLGGGCDDIAACGEAAKLELSGAMG